MTILQMLVFATSCGLVWKMQGLIAMKIAIAQWQGRIAPVFDVAGNLLLVDVEGGRETRREERRLLKTEFCARAAELLDYSIDVLICGAISAPLQFKIASSGVRVSAFICGEVDDVLTAYLNGTLASRPFAMPGCQRWRQRGGEDVLPAGLGAGRRRSRLGQGRGRVQNTMTSENIAATTEGMLSACPKCGEKLPCKASLRQLRNMCPKCGALIASL